jgi:hypothetical protein
LFWKYKDGQAQMLAADIYTSTSLFGIGTRAFGFSREQAVAATDLGYAVEGLAGAAYIQRNSLGRGAFSSPNMIYEDAVQASNLSRNSNNSLAAGSSTSTPPLSAFTQRYLTESGGRWGNTATRSQNYNLALDYQNQGYNVTFGGGFRREEYIGGSGPGNRGGTFVDLTVVSRDGRTIRIQTVDTLSDGITPTPREAAAAARIRAAFPNDELRLIPKAR